jgi:hypothetical protein
MNAKSNPTNLIESKSWQSVGWTLLLIILGLGALYGGTNWLALLIPAAVLVWYAARPMVRSSRN